MIQSTAKSGKRWPIHRSCQRPTLQRSLWGKWSTFVFPTFSIMICPWVHGLALFWLSALHMPFNFLLSAFSWTPTLTGLWLNSAKGRLWQLTGSQEKEVNFISLWPWLLLWHQPQVQQRWRKCRLLASRCVSLMGSGQLWHFPAFICIAFSLWTLLSNNLEAFSYINYLWNT